MQILRQKGRAMRITAGLCSVLASAVLLVMLSAVLVGAQSEKCVKNCQQDYQRRVNACEAAYKVNRNTKEHRKCLETQATWLDSCLAGCKGN